MACTTPTLGRSAPLAPSLHYLATMLTSIALVDLESVVGGHGCTCSQQGGDPSGGQEQVDPSQQQPMQQPGGEQQPQGGALSAEQVLQSIAGLIGQFMQQRGGQQ